MARRLLLATGNAHKVDEIAEILTGWTIEALDPEVDETGTTFEENAALKAHALAQQTGEVAIADEQQSVVTGSHAVPGTFTREAWEQYIQPAINEAAKKEVQTSDWVLGVNARDDLALRKWNVVSWETPLARRHLTNVPSLPYLIVYGKDGKRVRAISGFNLAALDRAAAARPNPGRVASRRLNRAEYRNSIRDLLGLEGLEPLLAQELEDEQGDDGHEGHEDAGDRNE